MNLKLDDINNSINILNLFLSDLSLITNYYERNNELKRILLVEGNTDKQFIKNILKEGVNCYIATQTFTTSQTLKESLFTESNVPPQEIPNAKHFIIQVVYGLSEGSVITKPSESTENSGIQELFEKYTVFGMVDLDNDESDYFMSIPRLFVTDTHDLETLLLSTDDGLLKECVKPLPPDDSMKAFYLAYQLGVFRKVFCEVNKNLELNLKPIDGGGQDEVKYGSFVDENDINLENLLRYLYENNQQPNQQPPKGFSKLLESIKKNFNCPTWENFDSSKIEDFWTVVNGHDILSLLRYINPVAREQYSNYQCMPFNRDFEFALIDKYDYENEKFKGTNIFKKMQKEEVVDPNKLNNIPPHSPSNDSR